MKNDLIERYIYAATKRLPRKQREDVSLELQGLIEDMLLERCQDRIPEDRDIRVVLTELGTPQEVYARYDEDADKCLIGEPYYKTYLFVLKIVLGSVAVGLTIAHILLLFLESGNAATAFLGWLNGMWNSLFGAFAFVTLLFAYFQRKGIRLSEPFRFEDLPPVPKKSKEISRWESIAGIGFDVVFVVLFLFVPEVFSMYSDGLTVPIFDISAVRSAWLPVVAFAACGIIREAVQLLEGAYNRKVLITACVTNVLSAVLCFWWILGHKLLNPAFVGSISALFAGESAFIMNMFANFDRFFLAVMLFALVLDTVDVTVRTLRK